MRFSKQDLLTLLISLFILSGCKNPDGVGLNVDNGLSGTLFVDTTVTLNTELEDSTLVSGIGRNALAFFTDPEVGQTYASIATNINLPSGSAYTIPTGTITIDSAILALKYNSTGFYGDSVHSTYKVNVHQLAANDKPNNSANYYSSKTWAYNPDPIGTKTFLARPHDTLRITSIIKGQADTAIRVLPQLRIPISTSFIRGALFTEGTQIKSNDNFQAALRGFYITLDTTATTRPGGIISFGTLDSLSVYIKVTNGTTIDTSVVSLAINRHISEIKHSPSAAVAAALANKTSSNTKAYIKGMGGYRVKVGFPGLQELKNQGSNIVINRAELVIQPYPGTRTPYAPLPYLSMYKFDLAKQRTFVEDMVGSYALLFGGRYNVPVENEYRFLLTSYIQNLVTGKTQDYGTYIGAGNEISTNATDISPTAYPIARTVLDGRDPRYRVKLNVIYTKIK